nr:response regulator [Bacteroidota bacterium]
AKDAMPQGGTLTFKTSNVDGSSLLRKFPNATAEQYVCVSVQDTGSGIPEEDMKKIFEPFYTTKERGKGTGLGLAVVYGVVTAHQGFIDVESTVGKGTTFYLYFPVSELYELQQTEVKDVESYKGTGSILLVEDEDALREIATSILESSGYTVFPATDGEEALRIFDENMDTIDIVLTDLGLPKMDGTELIRRLVSKKPTLKTIVGSGYFEPEKKEELEALGVKLLLQKPYRPQELLSGVYRIIHS